VPSTHMRCRMTANLLASATMARRMPQAFSHDHFLVWVSIDCAASYSIARSMLSLHFGDTAVVVDLARLMALRRQTSVGSDCSGMNKAV
jgi:hypothetical protein